MSTVITVEEAIDQAPHIPRTEGVILVGDACAELKRAKVFRNLRIRANTCACVHSLPGFDVQQLRHDGCIMQLLSTANALAEECRADGFSLQLEHDNTYNVVLHFAPFIELSPNDGQSKWCVGALLRPANDEGDEKSPPQRFECTVHFDLAVGRVEHTNGNTCTVLHDVRCNDVEVTMTES
jgi:hypothetical protein